MKKFKGISKWLFDDVMLSYWAIMSISILIGLAIFGICCSI